MNDKPSQTTATNKTTPTPTPIHMNTNNPGSTEPSENEKAVPVASTTEHGGVQPAESQSDGTMPPVVTAGKAEASELELPSPIEMNTPTGSFGLSDLALPQNFSDLIGVTSEATSVPLQKPGKQVWFSPHPDQKKWRCYAVLKDDNDGAQYIVHPALLKELAGEYSVKILVPCVTKQGTYTVWPIGTPGPDGKMNSWHESALFIAKKYGGKWIRLTANSEAGGYEVSSPVSPPPAPDWPDDLFPILETSMKGKVIDTLSHSLIKRLRGEI